MRCIIDKRADNEIIEYFKKLGYKCILLDKQDKVYAEISSHPDVFFVNINDNIFKSKSIQNIDINAINVNTLGLNISIDILSKTAILNRKYTDKDILKYLEENNYRIINVKQRYASCSILNLGNNCIVTADKGIYKSALENEIEVFLLDEKDLDIKLYDENNNFSNMKGFIGGATKVIDNKVIFFGDIKYIKNFTKLKEYINSKGYEIVYFKDKNLIDLGSVITKR